MPTSASDHRHGLFNAGDVNGVVAQFEDTAVVMPPGTPAVNGIAQIRQFTERAITDAKAQGTTLVLGANSDVGVARDLGWQSGAYAITTRAGGAVDTGKYLESWRKAGGQWRMVRRI